MNLSIVVPCYNEAGNIPEIVSRFSGILKENKDVEVLLVDNGSTDSSAMILKDEIKKFPEESFRVVKIEKNLGYGHGILTGLRQASGSNLAWTHADLQTDPEDVIKGYNLLSKNGERCLVKGKRKRRRISEAIFTFGMQLISFLFLKTYIDDINAQPKVFTKNFFENHIDKNAPLDFSLDLYLLYQAKAVGLRMISFPVYFKKRLHGEAKGGGSFRTRVKLIKRTLLYINELSKQVKS